MNRLSTGDTIIETAVLGLRTLQTQ